MFDCSSDVVSGFDGCLVFSAFLSWGAWSSLLVPGLVSIGFVVGVSMFLSTVFCLGVFLVSFGVVVFGFSDVCCKFRDVHRVRGLSTFSDGIDGFY